MSSQSSEQVEGKKVEEKCGWRVKYSQAGIYTGGKYEVSSDGSLLVALCADNVAVVEASTGILSYKVAAEPEPDEDSDFELSGERFTTFALHPTGKSLLTASDNQLLKVWDLGTDKATLMRSWKGHEGPVLVAVFHHLGDLVATGSSDRTVKVWSVKGGYCTHNFRGHISVISFLQFHPDPQRLHLFSSDNSGAIRLWSLLAGQKKDDLDEIYRQYSNKHAQFDNHLSAVSSMAFDTGGDILISAGRDKVVNIWNIEDGSNDLLKTVPIYESLEAVVVIPSSSDQDEDDTITFATTGEKGIVKVWKYSPSDQRQQCTCIHSQKEDGKYPHLGMIYHPKLRSLIVSNEENHLIYLDPATLEKTKQLIGYNDEILDLKTIPGAQESIVMATNSKHAQIVNISTFDSKLLVGHTDTILSVDVTQDGKFVATSSKDTTCRIWDTNTRSCVALCRGHTEAVTCINFLAWSSNHLLPRKKKNQVSEPLLVSTGSDQTLKVWNSQGKRGADDDTLFLNADETVIAHQKTINALALSPGKRLLATASQDKTIKIWSLHPFAQNSVLTGHKRGVWSIQFSPVEKCLVSASSDKTIRLWSVSDSSCISVFEGHEASVIRVMFLNRGTSLMSAASSGTMKLWSIKKKECIGTMNHHKDRVWALANGFNEKQLITGGGDSAITVWQDMSDEILEQKKREDEEVLLKEEEMYANERKKNYKSAAVHALELNRPHKLRNILEKMIASKTAEEQINEFVSELEKEQIKKLWEIVRDWNTRGRTCAVAQFMISHLVDNKEYALNSTANVDTIIKPLLAYSERHHRRIEKILQNSYLLDHALACMQK